MYHEKSFHFLLVQQLFDKLFLKTKVQYNTTTTCNPNNKHIADLAPLGKF